MQSLSDGRTNRVDETGGPWGTSKATKGRFHHSFRRRVQNYDDTQVKDTARWLSRASDLEWKTTGSIVFPVASVAASKGLLRYGLNILGKNCRVEAYRSHSARAQCFRCQGYGHNPKACKGPVACRLCSKNHFTFSHKCSTCGSSSACNHQEAKCTNCSQSHAANSKSGWAGIMILHDS
jgi:hypothetical protein